MGTRTTRAERRWRGIIDKWRQSGLSAPEFAKGRGISAGMIYVWSSRLGKKGAELGTTTPSSMMPTLLPVEVIDGAGVSEQAQSPALEVVLPRGEVIRVPPGADLSQLGRVVVALRGGVT